MEPLTRRQKEILDYIRSFIDENGYAPSFREIAYYFELSSVSTVAEYISILEEKGYLTKRGDGGPFNPANTGVRVRHRYFRNPPLGSNRCRKTDRGNPDQ